MRKAPGCNINEYSSRAPPRALQAGAKQAVPLSCLHTAPPPCSPCPLLPACRRTTCRACNASCSSCPSGTRSSCSRLARCVQPPFGGPPAQRCLPESLAAPRLRSASLPESRPLPIELRVLAQAQLVCRRRCPACRPPRRAPSRSVAPRMRGVSCRCVPSPHAGAARVPAFCCCCIPPTCAGAARDPAHREPQQVPEGRHLGLPAAGRAAAAHGGQGGQGAAAGGGAAPCCAARVAEACLAVRLMAPRRAGHWQAERQRPAWARGRQAHALHASSESSASPAACLPAWRPTSAHQPATPARWMH